MAKSVTTWSKEKISLKVLSGKYCSSNALPFFSQGRSLVYVFYFFILPIADRRSWDWVGFSRNVSLHYNMALTLGVNFNYGSVWVIDFYIPSEEVNALPILSWVDRRKQIVFFDLIHYLLIFKIWLLLWQGYITWLRLLVSWK